VTIGRPAADPPSPQGGNCADEPPGCAEVQIKPSETILDTATDPRVSADRTSTDDDRQAGVIGLAGRILSSWPHTARALVLFAVLVGVLAAALWLVPAAVELGPLRITPY